jgi:hypothetical protein
MPLARFDDIAMRLAEKIVAKTERLLQRTGFDEGARVGGYARDGAQRQRRYAETSVATHDSVEPNLTRRVSRRVSAESIDEHIHVG